MWLLDTSSLRLKEFIGSNIPPYAILSHTWGLPEDEVSFRDLQRDRDTAISKSEYGKVQRCCRKAAEDGFLHVWIDTCCIDKRSSAELSEAINSMFKWYQNAQVCYVYLSDVPSASSVQIMQADGDALSKSRWFTRGWTLQELIAPRLIKFFAHDWTLIGTKGPPMESSSNIRGGEPLHDPFLSKLVKITGIEEGVLRDSSVIGRTSLAQRMFWVARRQTTRDEDIAYALMGLFGVSMPILYGEGLQKAFKRLQLEIIESSSDQSIFAWQANRQSSGLLAESPLDFAHSDSIHPWRPVAGAPTTLLPYSMTNIGLSITLPYMAQENTVEGEYGLAGLRCWVHHHGTSRRIQIRLKRIQRFQPSKNERYIYRRVFCERFELVYSGKRIGHRQDMYILENDQYNHLQLVDNLSAEGDDSE